MDILIFTGLLLYSLVCYHFTLSKVVMREQNVKTRWSCRIAPASPKARRSTAWRRVDIRLLRTTPSTTRMRRAV